MTKKQSAACYGVAILFMLYHHLFCIPERLQTEYFSVADLIGGGTERRLAWFCKICVAIYAFISGYGLFHSIRPLKQGGKTSARELGSLYASTGKRILAFYGKYWLVFAVFIPMGVALGAVQIESPLQLFKALSAYRIYYNGEWWYVKQYLVMLLFLPPMDLFFDFLLQKERRTFGTFSLLAALGCLYKGLLYFTGPNVFYCLIFLIGYLCARGQIFTRLENHIPAGWVSVLLGLGLFAAAFVIRSLLADDASYFASDPLLAPVVVFSLCLLTRKQGKGTACLAWLGKYSVYMWLTHTFFCYYYFREWSTASHISTLMYLQLIAVSLGTAIVLHALERLLARLLSGITSKLKKQAPASQPQTP